MKAAAFRWGALLVIGLTMAVPVRSDDGAESGSAVSDRDRVFRNYVREAATVGDGVLRLELRGYRSEDDHLPDLDVLGFPLEEIERNENNEKVTRTNGGVVSLLGSYGLGPNAEVGFDIPYVYHKLRLQDPNSGNERSRSGQDVGDIDLYVKLKRQVANSCQIAAGVELSPPTGPERKYVGTGELAVNPFLSTRYQRGRIGAGFHVGYQVFTGSVADVLNYSAHVLARGSSNYALRIEFSGRHFKDFNREFDDVLVFPGIDFNLTEHITIRPTGMFNITDESHDWGIGVGIAGQLPIL